MKNKFLKELSSIIDYNQYTFLLAISGGVDSMVLAHLFKISNIKFSMAHCNFCLRGNESDLDEKFVRSFSKKIEVDCFVQQFDTNSLAKKNKLSIQMAARQIRYDWFLELMNNNKIDFLVTAHHYDDIIETFFINISRGTSISGLTGINKKENKLIRPLLPFQKNELLDFARKHKISYREDSSNQDEKYVRNKIRHSIIPEFEEINPSFNNTVKSTIRHLQSIERIYQKFIKKEKKRCVDIKNEIIRIDIEQLQKSSEPKNVLYEILKEYHFSDIDSIFNSINSVSGKFFFTQSHYLVKDRKAFLITKIIEPVLIKITKSTESITDPIEISFKVINSVCENKNQKIALLNYNKLSFPLILRNCRKGDWFIPSGMTGKKKLSDYFIDSKFSMIDKQKCLVLCSQEDIVWVVGHRVDERYKLVGTQEKAYICRTK